MPYDPERHGPRRVVGPGFHDQVYALVRTIPAGRLATYGDIAAALGLRNVARHVGFALAALPPDRADVPWHRVVNSTGRLSVRGHGSASREQRRRHVRHRSERARDEAARRTRCAKARAALRKLQTRRRKGYSLKEAAALDAQDAQLRAERQAICR